MNVTVTLCFAYVVFGEHYSFTKYLLRIYERFTITICDKILRIATGTMRDLFMAMLLAHPVGYICKVLVFRFIAYFNLTFAYNASVTFIEP